MKRCVIFLIEFIKVISPFVKSNKLLVYYNFNGYVGEDRAFMIRGLQREINRKYGKYFDIEYSDTSRLPRVEIEINSKITKPLFIRKVRMEIQSILTDYCNRFQL